MPLYGSFKEPVRLVFKLQSAEFAQVAFSERRYASGLYVNQVSDLGGYGLIAEELTMVSIVLVTFVVVVIVFSSLDGSSQSNRKQD